MSNKDIARFTSDKIWDRFNRIISNFVDNDVGKQKIVWASKVNGLNGFGEDSGAKYLYRELEVLCNYNVFRNWPINKDTVSGELDQENLCIIVTKNYLEKLGYINQDGYFDFNWSEDRFILHGIVYKPSGDTEVSQSQGSNLLFQIILKRDLDSTLNLDMIYPRAFVDINRVQFNSIDGYSVVERI